MIYVRILDGANPYYYTQVLSLPDGGWADAEGGFAGGTGDMPAVEVNGLYLAPGTVWPAFAGVGVFLIQAPRLKTPMWHAILHEAVLGCHGSAVAGALVTIKDPTGHVIARGRTTAKGAFDCPIATPGRYTIEAAKDRYRIATWTQDVS